MTAPINDPAIAKALNEYNQLIASFQSVQLATSNADGAPEASYAPAVIDEHKHFYVFVSEMAAHTAHLLERKAASVMIIADESASSQIYARKRATFTCQAAKVPEHSPAWENIMALFTAKFGGIMEQLKSLGDFHLVELTPSKGRLVVGFGRAFDITGDRLDQLEHVKGEGPQGHGPAPAATGTAPALTEDDVRRIVSHMNDDHSDSVLDYVHFFGNRRDATAATLHSLDAGHLHIRLESGEDLRVPVTRPILTARDAHVVLVDMAKVARKSLAAESVLS